MRKPFTGAVAHDAGPWEVTHQTATDNAFDVVSDDGIVVATCGRTADTESAIAANARLIAAAPELLEAAQQAQCACTIRERDSGHLVDCWMPDLRAAIAKATGIDR